MSAKLEALAYAYNNMIDDGVAPSVVSSRIGLLESAAKSMYSRSRFEETLRLGMLLPEGQEELELGNFMPYAHAVIDANEEPSFPGVNPALADAMVKIIHAGSDRFFQLSDETSARFFEKKPIGQIDFHLGLLDLFLRYPDVDQVAQLLNSKASDIFTASGVRSGIRVALQLLILNHNLRMPKDQVDTHLAWDYSAK